MTGLAEFKQQASGVVSHLQLELAKIHTGRPTTSLIEDLTIPYQGANFALKQVASITIPDATSLLVAPWDRGNLASIEKAIRESSLNLSPAVTGEVVRIQVPPLSEERRREYTKLVDNKVESAKVALRNQRHEHLSKLKSAWDTEKTPEDERRRSEEGITKELAVITKQLEETGEAKKQELASL
jgi:ribosome recycling factor